MRTGSGELTGMKFSTPVKKSAGPVDSRRGGVSPVRGCRFQVESQALNILAESRSLILRPPLLGGSVGLQAGEKKLAK